MNDHAFARLIRHGARNADRRVAAWLAPVSGEATDKYLASSALVRGIDRASRTLSMWWMNSNAARLLSSTNDAWLTMGSVDRTRFVGVVILVAVAVHLAATIAQGPRAGWFWLILPAMAAAIGGLFVAGVRRATTR